MLKLAAAVRSDGTDAARIQSRDPRPRARARILYGAGMPPPTTRPRRRRRLACCRVVRRHIHTTTYHGRDTLPTCRAPASAPPHTHTHTHTHTRSGLCSSPIAPSVVDARHSKPAAVAPAPAAAPPLPARRAAGARARRSPSRRDRPTAHRPAGSCCDAEPPVDKLADHAAVVACRWPFPPSGAERARLHRHHLRQPPVRLWVWASVPSQLHDGLAPRRHLSARHHRCRDLRPSSAQRTAHPLGRMRRRAWAMVEFAAARNSPWPG